MSKDNLEKISPSEMFDADKNALKTIIDGLNNPNQTDKDTAIGLITQDPMATPVREALDSMMGKIDNLDLAKSIINAVASDESFIDNMVDYDLAANGITLSSAEMRAALLNALKSGNKDVLSVVTEAMLATDAIDEDEAAVIIAEILELNENDPEIVANVSKEGSNVDKLEEAFNSASPPNIGENTEASTINAINTATDQQIEDAYLDASDNPDFLNAIQEYDENIKQKMSEALANKLASTNGDDVNSDALSDAFNALSIEDLIKAIKQTLDLDTPVASLSKIFNNTMVNIDGFNPQMSENFLEQFNGKSGIPPTELVNQVLGALNDVLTPDQGTKMVKCTKDVLQFAEKQKLAKSLSKCMNDQAFRKAFEKSNPGLLDTLRDKKLLANMLKNLNQMDDLKNAKNMLAGQGAFDQEQEMDSSMMSFIDRFLNDLDGLAAEIIFKKTKEFETKILEEHNSWKNKQLSGLTD